VCEKDHSEKDAVIEQIREAFRGVVLGNGVGLLQGQGIDHYEDEAICQTYREGDKKLNWEAIQAENLDKCHSSLSFFDAEGMRFHLPVFLRADIKEELGWDPIFHLTQLDDYAKSKFILFSSNQRAAVRSYLLWVKDQPNYEFDREAIERSIEAYW
jgi:hypothetical protein